jgi:very-short-patch-repair endonuclease
MVRRGSTPRKQEFARRLRSSPSATEAALWQLLRRRQVLGFKFLRRALVLGRIPDFWCAEAKVAVEVDAGGDKSERDELFAEHGIRTVHVASDLVWHDPEAATALVAAALREQASVAKPR